jgi:hypothetical protein
VITSGEVIAAGDWSEEQVVAERKRDRAAKARHYGTGTASNFDQVDKLPDAESEPPSKPKVKWLSRLRSWIR